MLDVVEKYVTHVTIQNTNLEELTFKNFKISVEIDIKSKGLSKQEEKEVSNKFNENFEKCKNVNLGKLEIKNLEIYYT
jgi:hypothetical protein